MENIDPKIDVSTEVQSTDVGILSLLELRWMVILPDESCAMLSRSTWNCTPASTYIGDRHHLRSRIGHLGVVCTL